MAVHQPALDRTLAIWLDSEPDLSCKDSTVQHAVDDLRLSSKHQVGVPVPLASSHSLQALMRDPPLVAARWRSTREAMESRSGAAAGA
jgi:hypothetical protein